MQMLREILEPLLDEVLKSIGVTNAHWRSMLVRSREHDQGDLSLPCFPFAKELGKSPIEIAQQIAESLEAHFAIGEVNAVAGYLNIKANPTWLAQQVMDNAIRIGDAFGKKPANNTHILIEHTSANPNGPFHVGRARNAILGDTLVRLHRLFGNNVRAEYYVDDMGKQVGVLAWALKHLSKVEVEQTLVGREPIDEKWLGKADHERVRWYQAAQAIRQERSDKEDIEAEIGRMVHASEHGDEEVLQAFQDAYQPVLDGMLETLKRLGIDFNTFTKESMFVTNGDVSKLMEKFKTFEIHGTADNGAEFLDLGARGLKGKTEFFFRRGDGSSLYATRDIAYHIWKWNQCDRLINVLGEDHKLQAKQVGMTLTELGEKIPDVLFYSFIKLPEGKMSTRKGNVVYMDDLLEEAQAQAAAVVGEIHPDYSPEMVAEIAEAAGTSAVRFNIIKVSPDKGFTFRWEEALAFEGGSAPFIMYSHARACSIARKCAAEGIDLDAAVDSSTELPSSMPKGMVELLRTMCVHQDVLSKAVNDRRPHLFANQLLQLATSFNAFYRDCMILQDGELNVFNFQLSELARNLMRTSMQGLGIVPVEQM
ncbi:MAG: arginine--tRNA ligase [Euryarchaeota archaeon]|jgi:arginyl-tRNA synthetase|nr:arginine--tRNA ligase [Euryarchaeota archaeon]MBT5026622.1 arginine--tRNA ligase [Euryarchaeota archaeon]MBT6254891.1 arginine--tRNA ligase [Euryarchaeota archaeon]MBT7960549.1 arginine--tRNA ligase [Euryarchaeota archaeon]